MTNYMDAYALINYGNMITINNYAIQNVIMNTRNFPIKIKNVYANQILQ